MSARPVWPVSTGGVRGGVLGNCLWQRRGKTWLTAFVKTSFFVRPTGVVEPVEAPPLSRSERHRGGMPTRSLESAREDVPRRRLVDVMLAGDAYADDRGNRGGIRLLIRRGDEVVLDKRAEVFGDRPRKGAEPEPFERIRLGYERALGGIGYADNPMGTGIGQMTPALPNFVHPDAPDEQTIGFGPIAQTWPRRKALRGSFATKSLNRAIVELPADLKWEFFQVAPPDQRLAALQGGEIVEVHGMQPLGAVLRFRIPTGRVGIQIVSHGDKPPLFPDLRVEAISIDTARRTFHLLWRGDVSLMTPLVAAMFNMSASVKWATSEPLAPQSEPAPSQPAPSQPAPSQPAPSQPAPSQPAPSQPAPSQPAPSQPAPSQPATGVEPPPLPRRQKQTAPSAQDAALAGDQPQSAAYSTVAIENMDALGPEDRAVESRPVLPFTEPSSSSFAAEDDLVDSATTVNLEDSSDDELERFSGTVELSEIVAGSQALPFSAQPDSQPEVQVVAMPEEVARATLDEVARRSDADFDDAAELAAVPIETQQEPEPDSEAVAIAERKKQEAAALAEAARRRDEERLVDYEKEQAEAEKAVREARKRLDEQRSKAATELRGGAYSQLGRRRHKS